MAQIIKTINAYDTLVGPGITPETNPIPQVEKIISTTFGILTIIAVIFFTIQVILAGYGFISSQGDQEKIKTARKKLTNGILGLTIVVVAFGLAALLAKILGLGAIFDLNSAITNLTL
jgi:putative copper export protein